MNTKTLVAALPVSPHLFAPERIEQFAFDSGVNLVSAILILAAGFAIAGWLARWLRRALVRSSRIDNTLVPITVTLLRYSIIGITVIAVLNRFGVQTTSLIAVLGAAGLAIGLAIQGTLSNVAAGAMLLFLRPFKVGDWIKAAGTGGAVREIGLFTTVLIDADMVYISVPNSQIFSGMIVNYSREPTRRINFTVGIDYADDIEAAQAIILKTVTDDPRVLREPAPMVPVSALGASSVDLIVRCWTCNSDYWNVLYDLQKRIKLALDAGGITIPFPQHVVQLRPTADGKAAASPN